MDPTITTDLKYKFLTVGNIAFVATCESEMCPLQ